MIRLLHTGDLHLCSPLAAFSPDVAARRRERQFSALETFLGRSADFGVDLVLFAGDCFDTPSPDPDSVRRFFSLIGSLPVPAVIAPGNHDYYIPGGLYDNGFLPDNLYIFRDGTLSTFDFPALGLAVSGYAFTGDTMESPVLGRVNDRVPDRVSVLLAHGDLTSPLSRYAPLSAGQLELTGFAYAALGHIHKPTKPRRCGHTVAAYCGFFAGRGFDEPGPGTANLVEIEPRNVRITPIETGADRFEIQSLSCTGATDGESIRQLVRENLAAPDISPELALRLILTGEVGPDCRPDPAALARLGDKLALFEVRDETLPVFGAGFLQKDPGIRGAFYRAMLPRLQSANPEERKLAAEALRIGFAAIAGREV